MNPTALLLATFVLSIAGLFVFIWSLRKGLFKRESSGAHVIFAPEELGRFNDPASGTERLVPTSDDQAAELRARAEADRATAVPVFIMFTFAVAWLLVGSAAGLISSIKLHAPDFLVEQAWLSFGRLRAIHLNVVAYGWAPMGLLGLTMWLLPRLLRREVDGASICVCHGTPAAQAEVLSPDLPLARFERLVRDSPFRCVSLETVPIRPMFLVRAAREASTVIGS